MNGFNTKTNLKAGRGKPLSSEAAVMISSAQSTCGTDCDCWTNYRNNIATSSEERRALAPYQQCYCEGMHCNKI